MPGFFDQLGRFTGDDRWKAAATAAIALIPELPQDGLLLLPDWAAVTRVAHSAPAQSRTVRPTYHGDAWLALGGALLDRSMAPCSESANG
jgi:hypothetical protein